MDLFFIIGAAFAAGIITGVVVEHFFFKKDIPCDDTQEVQAIIDKIDIIIDDIKKTI